MNLGGALTGSLGGLMTGGPIGAAIGGIGGLLGGGGGGGGQALGGSGGMSMVSYPTYTPAPFISARLDGPDYTRPATALIKTATVGSIALLEVYPGTGTPMVQTLVTALGIVKIYLVPSGANVFLYLNANLLTPALLAKIKAACSGPVTTNPSQQQRLQLQTLWNQQQQQLLQQSLLAQQQQRMTQQQMMMQQNQMLADMQQQSLQNLMFQQQVNQQSQNFATLSNAQQAMHDAIMAMLNNAK